MKGERLALPVTQRDKRELWAMFGVVCDDLSAPVLTLNFHFGGDSSLARIANAASAQGIPLHLTTRLLWKTKWGEVTCPPKVFVCENPAIVSLAAERFGPFSAPLICVDGEPKSASRILLRQLQLADAQIFYHGDFDWAGVAIANRVMQEFGAFPWLFTEADYSAVVGSGRPLYGRPVATPWDEHLSVAMEKRQTAFDEEALAESLLAEVAMSGPVVS